MTATATRLLLAALVFPALFVQAQQDAFRVWKSTDGKTVEAAFLGVEGASVKIKGRNGAIFSVPLERLSADDQTWAKAQAASAPAAAPTGAAGNSESPAADAAWPKSLSIADKPQVTVVMEDEKAKKFVYRSPHYEFECDSKLGANVVREFGRMFEATYLLNCKLPLDLRPKPEPLREFFLAKLYTNQEDYLKEGGMPGSAGVYQRGQKALSVPLKSLGVKMVGSRVSIDQADDDANATLIHEITHQMMNHWLAKLPTWFIEGSADYTTLPEYFPTGRFAWTGLRKRLEGYALQKNRFEQGAFKMLDIQELMEIKGGAWAAALTLKVKAPNVVGGEASQSSQNYGSAALLTYFFYHHDDKGDAAHVIAWLRELETAERGFDAKALIEKHLMRGRSYAQLADEVKKGLNKAGIDVEFDPPGKNPATSDSN
ncbi:SHD1 domain-containing protein [Brevifollis gellanilyticus]|uniref:SLA1 homology domain-containing protein n=1 Tax=Brevifollis gellanilyticus TaxID=748831 RepID=A0A512M7M2_9BACT|nr:SHD1 domain-containing protein [Brevifollis gellanilyticus]GEP42738.1 hypothetical protein BGE01nite_20290 [Brevifollis gellanilyticus]